ncbi:hypothetical protein P691DRAFT_784787 [Macrolepiota fuliginosa MF-IS2]|uniref:Uncharacterized protein n=1 Tax=Macrolepiota fuliginosa MF-IS2 TaxID=1400762 RepID=A0A9P5WW04_9AGAR|nr:hypothetical protein P691DRAFT_784787 [Macrolepiota fuliginosa MF-IS2]
MPCKAKTKPASNAPVAFKPSSNTECFLTSMNQNHRLVSQFTPMELMSITQGKWEEVLQDLRTMKFVKVDEDTPTSSTDDAPINEDNKEVKYLEEELTPAEDLTNYSAEICQCAHANDIPPPPPCQRAHCDDEDTPMEPPALTHVFSEAASQTPAPSHEASTPPPPPAAAASIPPAGPHGCASYTGAVARNLNPAAPPFVCGPPCAPVAQPPAQAQQPISSKCLKRPFFMTRGPSCRQFFIEAPNIPSDTSLSTMVITANRAVMQAKSTLKVDSACLSPCGITCATATIPSTSDLNIIEATLSGGLTGACVSIPASRSFIKIVDIPFFKSGTMDPFSSTEVDAQLQCSIIPSDFVVHWCYVQNSPKADSATIWIDLSDSQ